MKKQKATDMTNLRVLERIDPSWRCPICGGAELTILDERQNAVECTICSTPFSLSMSGESLTPLPAYSDEIMARKKEAWVDQREQT